MSLSTVLQGEIRKTKLESLIKCCLDDSHKELQTVLQQGVDGRDESRCAGSCNRAPSSCTGVHQDYIHLSIKALMLCCTLQSLVLDPAMNTCHGLVPVRLRCHKHTQLIHYETRAAFPLCRPFHIEGVTFSTCIHRLGMLSRCHVHIHNKSQMAIRHHGILASSRQVLAHYAGPRHCSSLSMAAVSDCCVSECCSPIRFGCAMWARARASSG